ncbi:MAG: hypothetical protein ACI9YG_002277, partial [Candidatus Azotimanducaceae bacterium]
MIIERGEYQYRLLGIRISPMSTSTFSRRNCSNACSP